MVARCGTKRLKERNAGAPSWLEVGRERDGGDDDIVSWQATAGGTLLISNFNLAAVLQVRLDARPTRRAVWTGDSRNLRRDTSLLPERPVYLLLCCLHRRCRRRQLEKYHHRPATFPKQICRSIWFAVKYCFLPGVKVFPVLTTRKEYFATFKDEARSK